MRAVKDVHLKLPNPSNGYYFVTIVTNRRVKHFAGQKKDVVARFIGRLSKEKGVSVQKFVVMDDHLHLILGFNDCPMTLGEIVRRFKARTSQACGIRLWQPNYYEHIIRTERALSAIWEYVENNPMMEKLELESIYGRRPINRATTSQAGTNPMNRATTTNA